MDRPFYLDPDWRPPFCPNPNCRFHRDSRPLWHYKRMGYHHRRLHPERIPRWICLHCHRSFSGQTFHFSYWQKRPDVGLAVFMKVTGGMAARQIARDLQVSGTTIDHHLERMGRHCLLFHHEVWQRTKLEGPLVIDGLEGWEFSQYFPFHHHMGVEDQSSFVISFTDSPLRRKGRMTPGQKRRRQQLETRLGRPDPKAVLKDVSELLEVCLQGLEEATVRSDDHKAYPPALRQQKCRIRHEVTSSKKRRDGKNPLAEINSLERLIRHSQAGHRRETIAAPKRRQGSAERMAILLVWRNYVKWRCERGPQETPAMIKGLWDRRLSVEEIFNERLFRTRIDLKGRWSEYYDRAVQTPVLPINRRHKLSYAY